MHSTSCAHEDHQWPHFSSHAESHQKLRFDQAPSFALQCKCLGQATFRCGNHVVITHVPMNIIVGCLECHRQSCVLPPQLDPTQCCSSHQCNLRFGVNCVSALLLVAPVPSQLPTTWSALPPSITTGCSTASVTSDGSLSFTSGPDSTLSAACTICRCKFSGPTGLEPRTERW